MDIKTNDFLSATGGRPIGALNESFPIHRISTDTRTIERDDAFFALIGERFDGHDFITEALQKGARHCVVSDPKRVPPGLEGAANFILVEDTRLAYGDLARFYRQQFKIPAVAVTGSCGKTTVKEMLAHVLSQKFRVLKNRGTENNLIGVPKTILQLEPGHEVLVLELGTNRPGEIERLSSILSPQIGIVTQIGIAHLEGLGDLEGVRAEKLRLLNHLERGGILILNGHDAALRDAQSGVHRVLRVGFAEEGHDLTAERIWCHEGGTSFYVGEKLIETHLIGRHNILNCLLVILAASSLGLPFSMIQQGLATFKPVPGRVFLRNIGGVRFIDDSYNSNPNSFKAALETLKEFKIREKKGVVCGDMLELGASSEEIHREFGALLAGFLFDFVIAAGPRCKLLVEEALKRGFDPQRIHAVQDSQEAGRLCRELAAPGDFILVKGSRGMQMEKVFECFITSSTL